MRLPDQLIRLRNSLSVYFWVIGALQLMFLVNCQPMHTPPGDADNGGLILPDEFEALVVIDSVPGKVRHLTVSEQGDIYAKLKFSDDGGGSRYSG